MHSRLSIILRAHDVPSDLPTGELARPDTSNPARYSTLETLLTLSFVNDLEIVPCWQERALRDSDTAVACIWEHSTLDCSHPRLIISSIE